MRLRRPSAHDISQFALGTISGIDKFTASALSTVT